MTGWATASVQPTSEVRAPDGSEIRGLVAVAGGSLVHCRLLVGQVTRAVQHRTVEEVWFCLSGVGRVWRHDVASGRQETVTVSPGMALSIPLGTAFQFRTSGKKPLDLLVMTIPRWPGDAEAVAVAGRWAPSV